jgi:prepilin-type N-terminal cleavage/methylation domain-containing protein/prepilin-type processing-associated H-X9-DG protein
MNQHQKSAHVSTKAFTLIELLVVVAVIAILIGVLLPALGQARAAAWKIGGANNQRQLNIGMYTYGAENDGWIPGVATTGEPLWGGRWDIDDLSKYAGRPVQTFDWMTPCLNADDLPDEWAPRFAFLLNQLACPAQRLRLPTYGEDDPEAADLLNEYLSRTADGEATAPSFLMPTTMQVYGGSSIQQRLSRESSKYIRLGQMESGISVSANQATLPSAHAPRLDKMKNAANKIFCADGIRYIDVADDLWDFDPGIGARYYGSFATSTPIYRFSKSYPTGDPAEWSIVKPLALRHSGQMNATFFDGSGKTLDERTMMDPALWYPSRSEFHTGGDTAEASSLFFGYEDGDLLN